MKPDIDMDALLAPLEGDSPAGEDLRYSLVYEEIKEARRADEALAMGDWQRELKTADWSKVIALSTQALSGKTKDLQIAAWLCEALVMTGGFGPLSQGIQVLSGLLEQYWDSVYPLIEGDDIEYRIAPFEFVDDKLSTGIRSVPLTDSGYSWYRWQESREVGFETDTKNKYGDLDEQKKQRRDELIAEGKMTAETFDAAAAQTPPSFRKELLDGLARCREAFSELDRVVDEKFGKDAPRISDIGEALEECERLVIRLYREEKERTTEPEPQPESDRQPPSAPAEAGSAEQLKAVPDESLAVHETPVQPSASPSRPVVMAVAASDEQLLWEDSLKVLESGGMKKALDRLLAASCASPSERDRNRYRLLIGKLCLKAGRPDLARPILEGLHALIDELHLERWESPIWIAEVLDALYQCLTAGEPSDEDLARAGELFRRLCSMDVTKALLYRK
jgi:type VI secretion system protein ImpA